MARQISRPKNGASHQGRVDGFPVHAVMVGSEIIRPEIGAGNNHRVEGRAFHPTVTWTRG